MLLAADHVLQLQAEQTWPLVQRAHVQTCLMAPVTHLTTCLVPAPAKVNLPVVQYLMPQVTCHRAQPV